MALSGVTGGRTKPLDLRRVNRARDQLMLEYKKADQWLARQLSADLAEGRLGTAAYRNQRIAVIQAELAALQSRTIPEATTVVTNAYIVGATQTATSMGVGAVNFGGGIHAEAVTILADNATSALNEAAQTVGRRVADVYRREGLRSAQRLFIEGSTRVEASSFLNRSLLEQGISAFTDAAGRQWSLETYTSMVLRTTASEAATQGVVNSLIDAGLDLVEVAVNDPCDICVPYEGNVYSLSGSTPGYDTLDDQPPFHPNCECTLVASDANIEQITSGA